MAFFNLEERYYDSKGYYFYRYYHSKSSSRIIPIFEAAFAVTKTFEFVHTIAFFTFAS